MLDLKNFTLTVSPRFREIKVCRLPLQQIMMNLIGNAIKHHDKEKGRVEVTVDDEGEYYAFAVKDDGPGIAAQFHEQIFEMFKTLRPKLGLPWWEFAWQASSCRCRAACAARCR